MFRLLHVAGNYGNLNRDNLLVQIGTGSYRTAGYQSSTQIGGNETTSTSGFLIGYRQRQDYITGHCFLTRLHPSTTGWIFSGTTGRVDNNREVAIHAGELDLGTVTQLRIIKASDDPSDNNFESGSVSLLEF